MLILSSLQVTVLLLFHEQIGRNNLSVGVIKKTRGSLARVPDHALEGTRPPCNSSLVPEKTYKVHGFPSKAHKLTFKAL